MDSNPKVINDNELEYILSEMCRRVGANYCDIDFSKGGWFCDYQWTKEEEKDFINWLTEYFYSNGLVRKKMLTFSRRDKKICKKAAEEFAFMYGWKFKDVEL